MNLEQKNMAFDSFIEEYKEKSLREKQDILVAELKELIAVAQKVCIDKGVNSDLLINREITDIDKDNYSQDDFVEAIYVYLQMFKELISPYLLSNYNDSKE